MSLESVKLWLTVEAAAPILGDTPPNIWRKIREGKFPHTIKREGRAIRIFAPSIGVSLDQRAQSNEAQPQDQSLATTA